MPRNNEKLSASQKFLLSILTSAMLWLSGPNAGVSAFQTRQKSESHPYTATEAPDSIEQDDPPSPAQPESSYQHPVLPVTDGQIFSAELNSAGSILIITNPSTSPIIFADSEAQLSSNDLEKIDVLTDSATDVIIERTSSQNSTCTGEFVQNFLDGEGCLLTNQAEPASTGVLRTKIPTELPPSRSLVTKIYLKPGLSGEGELDVFLVTTDQVVRKSARIQYEGLNPARNYQIVMNWQAILSSGRVHLQIQDSGPVPDRATVSAVVELGENLYLPTVSTPIEIPNLTENYTGVWVPVSSVEQMRQQLARQHNLFVDDIEHGQTQQNQTWLSFIKPEFATHFVKWNPDGSAIDYVISYDSYGLNRAEANASVAQMGGAVLVSSAFANTLAPSFKIGEVLFSGQQFAIVGKSAFPIGAVALGLMFALTLDALTPPESFIARSSTYSQEGKDTIIYYRNNFEVNSDVPWTVTYGAAMTGAPHSVIAQIVGDDGQILTISTALSQDNQLAFASVLGSQRTLEQLLHWLQNGVLTDHTGSIVGVIDGNPARWQSLLSKNLVRVRGVGPDNVDSPLDDLAITIFTALQQRPLDGSSNNFGLTISENSLTTSEQFHEHTINPAELNLAKLAASVAPYTASSLHGSLQLYPRVSPTLLTPMLIEANIATPSQKLLSIGELKYQLGTGNVLDVLVLDKRDIDPAQHAVDLKNWSALIAVLREVLTNPQIASAPTAELSDLFEEIEKELELHFQQSQLPPRGQKHIPILTEANDTDRTEDTGTCHTGGEIDSPYYDVVFTALLPEYGFFPTANIISNMKWAIMNHYSQSSYDEQSAINRKIGSRARLIVPFMIRLGDGFIGNSVFFPEEGGIGEVDEVVLDYICTQDPAGGTQWMLHGLKTDSYQESHTRVDNLAFSPTGPLPPRRPDWVRDYETVGN